MVTVRNGILVLGNATAAGTGSSALRNGGDATLGGGTLMLTAANPYAGITLARNLELQGSGVRTADSRNAAASTIAQGALSSIGNNTVSGTVTFSSAVANRMTSLSGMLTLSNNVTLGAGQITTINGPGNMNITGQVQATTGGIIKTGGGVLASTLILGNSANAFTGTVRVDSGTIRVANAGALGLNTGTAAMEFGGGTLEVRADSTNVGSFSVTNLATTTNNGTVLLDRAIGGYGTGNLNQTVDFGSFRFGAVSRTLTVNSRNGYAFSIGTVGTNVGGNGNNNVAFTTNANGLATFDGDVTVGDGTARAFTFTATGDGVFNGRVLQNGGDQGDAFDKGGTGTLTWNAQAASTIVGRVGINSGTLAISDLTNALGAGAIQLRLGNATTTAGTFTYIGAGESSSKAILINTTTGNAYINASGSGALTLSGAITNGVGVGGAHTIFLGGTNTADNTLTSAISAGIAGATSLQKIGAGTWVLAPTASNAFTGSTTISNGVLKLTDAAAIDILPDAGAVIFGVDTFKQAAGGTLNYTGGANTETAGALTATAGHGVVTATSGTLTFASLGARTAGGTINVSNTGVVNITGTSGFVNSGTYFNSSDFAYSGAGTTLRAPVYGTDAGFVNAAAGAATLTAGSHNQITGTITAQTVLAVNSIKNSGAFNLTTTGVLTLGVAAGSGIIQTGGSATFAGSGINVSAAVNDFAVRVDGGGNTLTINNILGTSTAGLTKSGAGTLTLGGANTYSGTVRVNEGTLKMATGGLLGATSIGLAVRQGATFDLNGINVGTIASGTNSVDALNGAGTITNTGALATLRVGNGNTAGYFTGDITGTNLSLVKNGSGALSLTSTNSSFGALTISAGTVAFALPQGTTTMNASANSPIGFGATADALVFNGGTLQYTGSTGTIFSATQTPSITTNRLFTLATGANGTIDSSGTYGNAVLATGVANNAALIFNNSSGAIAYSGTGTAHTLTLTGTSTGDNEMGIQLVETGGHTLAVTKATTATTAGSLWILSNTANAYNGATTITGGQLRANYNGLVTLPSSSNLVFNAATSANGGVLESSGTFSRALGTSGSNTVQWSGVNGGGFAGSEAKLTVNIGGNLTPDTLTWGTTAQFINANSATVAGLILNSTTALSEVEWQNPLNLGTATYTNPRLITVLDNTTTNTDFATISGNILAGTPGANVTALAKNGAGTLYLTGANTFVGNGTGAAFNIQDGAVVVNSFASGGPLGDATAPTTTGRLLLGSAALNPALIYNGAGETVTRSIDLSGTGGTSRVENDGSGPLNLTDVTNTSTGTKTFNLRGLNTDFNQVSQNLVNGAGTLAVSKDDQGFWALMGNNTFTGGVTHNGGVLGIGSNTALGTGTFAPTNNNSVIQAIGGDRVLTNNWTQTNNTTVTATGNFSLTFANLTDTSGNVYTVANFITGVGKSLTFTGTVSQGQTDASRALSLTGTGTTVLTGVIRDNTAVTGQLLLTNNMAGNVQYGPGTLRIGGASANTFTGNATLTAGITELGKVGSLTPLGNGGSILFNGNSFLQSTVAMTGSDKLANPTVTFGSGTTAITATIQGSQNIEFGGNVTNPMLPTSSPLTTAPPLSQAPASSLLCLPPRPTAPSLLAAVGIP